MLRVNLNCGHCLNLGYDMGEQPFKVFRAEPRDIRLAQQAINEVNLRSPIDEAGVSIFISNPTCYLLLAVENDHVVGSLNGYALCHPHLLQPQFLLYEVNVRPDHQRRGIGQALVNGFIAEAKRASAFEVWVLSNESNTAAIELYNKRGFRRRNRDDVMLSMTLLLI